MSNGEYKFNEIEFYNKFPEMIPFVGDNYISDKHKKLLVVSESYYFSKNASNHDNYIFQNAEIWYSSNDADIENKELLDWINCNDLLSKKKWRARSGHKIYMSIESCLKNAHVQSSDGKKLIQEIAFTNFFQRPALEGMSFFNKGYCTKFDIDKSFEIFSEVVSIINPDIIVFTSKRIHDELGTKLKDTFSDKEICFVCHPASYIWWNKKNYNFSKYIFIELLKNDFLL